MTTNRQFFMPCADARIMSRQGWRQLPGEDRRWHNGTDFVPAGRPAEGEPLLAVGPGRIRASVESGTPGFRGYGRCVVLELGPSVLALYGHCRDLFVREGEDVQGGQPVASIGRTSGRGGDPTVLIATPHVHFEFPQRWPLASDDTYARYDVLATFATAGIVEVRGRLVYQDGLPSYIVPSGLTRSPSEHSRGRPTGGVGGFVELLALAAVVRAINEERS